ncbi:MAG: phage portal protein [Rhodospirillaceae bacterium]|nr:phage portal protein [Rhodospirillaceae bacterium]
MRLWPKREQRSEEPVDATAAAIARLTAAAVGTGARPETLAALEIAAGYVGRSFASAAVEEGSARRLLSRKALALIGRTLILKGELLFVAEDAVLIPAASFDIRGDAKAWSYRADFAGPSRQTSRFLPADSVLHFRVNASVAEPWRGRPAHSLASETAATAANAEKSARAEAAVPVSRFVPRTKDRLQPDQQQQMQDNYMAQLARGGFFLIPPDGEGNPRTELVHPDLTDGHIELRRSSALALIEAAGVPAALVDPRAEANGQREAFRRFVHSTIEPMARCVEEEFSDKTGLTCRLDFSSLYAADLAGRGRALKQMVDSGVDRDMALAIVGLESKD